MPDWHQSTDQALPIPSPRGSRASSPGQRNLEAHNSLADSASECTAPAATATALRSARTTLRETVGTLRQIDELLAASIQGLPAPSRQFDPAAELRAAAECVRADLLADAIETLHAASNASESQLRSCFEERQRWLALART